MVILKLGSKTFENVGMHRISGRIIRPFFISGLFYIRYRIRPDTGYVKPDIRLPKKPDIRPKWSWRIKYKYSPQHSPIIWILTSLDLSPPYVTFCDPLWLLCNIKWQDITLCTLMWPQPTSCYLSQPHATLAILMGPQQSFCDLSRPLWP